jgi:hypothetical protein
MSEAIESDETRREEGRIEAIKTFSEQTKILITLASGFVLAPPAVLSFLRRPDGKAAPAVPWGRFTCAEGLLLASICCGYLVLSTIAGYQHQGIYDVYRSATRVFSLLQIGLYLAGVILFLFMIPALI